MYEIFGLLLMVPAFILLVLSIEKKNAWLRMVGILTMLVGIVVIIAGLCNYDPSIALAYVITIAVTIRLVMIVFWLGRQKGVLPVFAQALLIVLIGVITVIMFTERFPSSIQKVFDAFKVLFP